MEPVSSSRRDDAAPTSPATIERPESGADLREDHPRRSVFTRLGTESSRRGLNPDRYPDLRNCPSRGVLFGHLHPVPVDRAVDPDGDRCFNCWARGHTRFVCPEPRRLSCFNCGRRNVTMRNCPRCAYEHLSYLRGRDQMRVRGQPENSRPSPNPGNVARASTGPSSRAPVSGTSTATGPRSAVRTDPTAAATELGVETPETAGALLD